MPLYKTKDNVIDLFLCSNYDFDIVADIYGENILSWKFAQAEFEIPLGADCVVSKYIPINISAQAGIGVAADVRPVLEKLAKLKAGIGVGSTAKLLQIMHAAFDAGVGVAAAVVVGGEVPISNLSFKIPVGSGNIIHVYKIAYIRDYDDTDLASLYAKGNLQDAYLIEK